MAQGSGKPKKAKKASSGGSQRKKLGKTKKAHNTVRSDYLRDKAGKSFMQAIENEMATRVPSDQRAKLTLLKSSGPVLTNKKTGMKKPLTRGRSRKAKK